MDPALRPTSPVKRRGVFVGTAVGATTFPEVDGVTPQTAWGYLALQLGGATGYEHVRRDDEALTAPRANDLRKIER
jgi:predicted AAA+ superfamily ATPase